MRDEFQSYLGNINEGGGALHEHSHGLNLFQLIAKKYNLKIWVDLEIGLNLKRQLHLHKFLLHSHKTHN